MNIKEQLELEENRLSPYATKSITASGRTREDSEEFFRTEFQRDADKIVYCNSFSREKDKTQVIIRDLVENGDHYKTRMTHTYEVSRIGRTIARALRLNEDLIEAAALGHDLGHTPFGHTGERVLNQYFSFGFNHTEHSIRVAEVLEKNGQGLNLCKEVKDAILHHSGFSNSPEACTPEGQILPYADKIAYLTSDFIDAEHFGMIKRTDLPAHLVEIFGQGQGAAIEIMVSALISTSYNKPFITMESDIYQAVSEFRSWMFEHVYQSPEMMKQREYAANILTILCDYYMKYPEKMKLLRKDDSFFISDNLERSVCDFIAGMTDGFALNVYKSI